LGWYLFIYSFIEQFELYQLNSFLFISYFTQNLFLTMENAMMVTIPDHIVMYYNLELRTDYYLNITVLQK